jgi:hypothetical protein
MEFRVKMDDEDIGPRIKQNMDQLGHSVREAMRESAAKASQEILSRGAADIAGAGNFGGDWIDALHADITETQRTVAVNASYEPAGAPVTYWGVFQYGATISAKGPKGLMTWPNKSGFSIDGVTPAFISKASVTIPKKFHLIEIIEEVAEKTAAEFGELLAARI